MIAQVATKNEIVLYQDQTRKFTDKSLKELCDGAVGKKILLGFNGIELGQITKSWIENDSLMVEFEAETLGLKYLVPGFTITSSKNGEFETVRCLEFALTNNPADKTLKNIEELNNVASNP